MPEEAVTPSMFGLPDSLTVEQYWDALGGGATHVEEAAGRPDDRAAGLWFGL